ncbi:N-acetylmuramoyl-L-alanine amidase family protein [Natronospora cellulosivora (SeqCode)]
MRKYLSILLVFIMFFVFIVNTETALALDNNSNSDSLISIAKGVASLLLLNTAYNYIDNLSNRANRQEEIMIENQNEEKSQDMMSEEIIEVEEKVIDVGQGTRTGSISSSYRINSSDLSGQVIVIDPGHGGHDPGAVGPSGLKESDVVLDISLKLYDLLRENTSARVYLTRDTDVFIPLSERSAMANRLDADMFISVHSNADQWGRRRGIETYAHFNTSTDSWALAWYLQDSLVRGLGLPDNGLKADNFHVIRETAHRKSVLLEVGYISHPTEELFLSDYNNRTRAAQAIYQGLLDYYASL